MKHHILAAVFAVAIVVASAYAARYEQLTVGNLTVESDVTAPDGSLGAAELASGSVTAAKLATGAVEEGKIASSAVTTAKIANDAVTRAKIAGIAQVDTNTTTTTTLYTPDFEGQPLKGAEGGSNRLWFAFGLTSNDWGGKIVQ